jgi:SOS-response transcriptional repressor LexA
MESEVIQRTSAERVVEQAKLQLVLGDRLPPDAPFAMVVKGDCMEPEVHLNDVIICVPCAIPNDGDMVVLHTSSGFQLRRYVVQDGCRPFLVANNKTYPTKQLRQDHKICGKVVDIQKRH